LRAVGVAIAATVDVFDDEWRQDIDKLLMGGIEKIKKDADINEIIATLAGTLLRVSFTQIGLMPNRKGSAKSGTLSKEAWRLNPFRSVIYTQTSEQKERLFWSKQQREIGCGAQLDLHAEYRQSKAKIPYSEWCKNAKNA